MAGHIVVGVDGSVPATAAAEYAAEAAARGHATLRIVHVREPLAGTQAWQDVDGLDAAIQQYGEGVLAAAERHARERAPEVEVSTRLVSGDVIERLKDEAVDADELVIGSRGMGGFAGLILGSVSLGVAGHVPGPIVVVREPARRAYGEIVVGFDGGPRAEAALVYAFAEAGRRSARLKVVYAWQMPAFYPFAAGYNDLLRGVFDERAAVVSEQLTPWRDKHPDVLVEEEAVCGHATHALAEASRTADLVVVGSRGLGPMGAAFLGSVGHGLLHRAHCPVAVVRSGKEER
ncbi:universal stress protein [Microbispora sp. NPDC049125]|uniref:universal stress protein n=1 Tax=Microbispora sp. NPDC049125 TaxID=3154929 RepID=UPI00346755AB